MLEEEVEQQQAEAGALPAAVGSMCSAVIFDGLAALGLSISGEQGEVLQ
jgi:hypothetical protein